MEGLKNISLLNQIDRYAKSNLWYCDCFKSCPLKHECKSGKLDGDKMETSPRLGWEHMRHLIGVAKEKTTSKTNTNTKTMETRWRDLQDWAGRQPLGLAPWRSIQGEEILDISVPEHSCHYNKYSTQITNRSIKNPNISGAELSRV